MLKAGHPLTLFGAAVKRVLGERGIRVRALALELGLNEKYLCAAFYGRTPFYEYQRVVAEYLKREFGEDIPVGRPQGA
jgi:lambda repressor-like predicted transcriptional regulator